MYSQNPAEGPFVQSRSSGGRFGQRQAHYCPSDSSGEDWQTAGAGAAAALVAVALYELFFGSKKKKKKKKKKRTRSRDARSLSEDGDAYDAQLAKISAATEAAAAKQRREWAKQDAEWAKQDAEWKAAERAEKRERVRALAERVVVVHHRMLGPGDAAAWLGELDSALFELALEAECAAIGRARVQLDSSVWESLGELKVQMERACRKIQRRASAIGRRDYPRKPALIVASAGDKTPRTLRELARQSRELAQQVDYVQKTRLLEQLGQLDRQYGLLSEQVESKGDEDEALLMGAGRTFPRLPAPADSDDCSEVLTLSRRATSVWRTATHAGGGRPGGCSISAPQALKSPRRVSTNSTSRVATKKITAKKKRVALVGGPR